MKTILFGSILEKNINEINDIDIAIIVPNGMINYFFQLLNEKIRKLNQEQFFFVDRLLLYDKNHPDRKSSQLFHILICEEQDLESKHPIINSLKKGVEIKLAA